MTTGTVSFFPIAGKGGDTGQPAIGEIEPSGSFELTTFDTGDGAIVGQHKAIVVVRSVGAQVSPDIIPSQAGPDAYKPPKPPIPEKYMDPEKTPLRYTVKPGENTFDLKLKD